MLRPHQVQIAPGSIFSAAGKYRNCLRINYAAKPSAEIEQAIRWVGESVAELLAELG
jgi:DNA-binding transcriptional MocR family regulator